MWPPSTTSAPACDQRSIAASRLCSRFSASSGRHTAIGWCSTTTRSCSGRAACSCRTVRSICSSDTSPSLWRRRRVVLTPITSQPAPACTGSSSGPNTRRCWAYGQHSRASRLNSGRSWLPGTASSGTGPSRCTNARAASNWLRRARWVMSPDITTTSGAWSRTSCSSACTTGGRSVPKCGSEICSRPVIAAAPPPPPAPSAGGAAAAAAHAATPKTPVAAASRTARRPWPPAPSCAAWPAARTALRTRSS